MPYPIIQDIHVSLVWRFRGIKHKVDRSLIDDFYNKHVDSYKTRKTAAETKYMNVKSQRERVLNAMKLRSGVLADSTSFWDIFHRRRLEAAQRIKPDTVFTGKDHQDYLRLIKGIPVEKQEKYLKEQTKLQEKAQEARADSLKHMEKEADRRAKKESKRQAKASKSKAAKDTAVVVSDSLNVGADSMSVEADTTMMPREEIIDQPKEYGSTEEDGDAEKQNDESMAAVLGRKRSPIYINKV